MAKSIIITWSSWFIWYHTAKTLLDRGETIIGIDNENDYYDVSLKQARRTQLEKYDTFTFYRWDIADLAFVQDVFKKTNPYKVLNLAAQAGVRYSLENPFAYIQANLVGFHNMIRLAKEYKVQNFVYASSSSVYGSNEKQPFAVTDPVDHPISLYAATKKSNELITHTYSHLYDLPTTGLRFFTVYGPRGRPDMAMMIFANKIMQWKPIDVYNHGKMKRDFTYIDDIVSGIIASLDQPHHYEIFNLWWDHTTSLEEMISLIESNLGKQAIKNYMDIQPWDVPETSADINHTRKLLWREPRTSIAEGVEKTIEWFTSYNK